MNIKGIEVSGEIYDIEDETARTNASGNATSIGDLSELETTEKSSLVGAINEVASGGGSGGAEWEDASSYFSNLQFTGEASEINSEVASFSITKARIKLEGDTVTFFAYGQVNGGKHIMGLMATNNLPEKYIPNNPSNATIGCGTMYNRVESFFTGNDVILVDLSTGETELDGTLSFFTSDLPGTGSSSSSSTGIISANWIV